MPGVRLQSNKHSSRHRGRNITGSLGRDAESDPQYLEEAQLIKVSVGDRFLVFDAVHWKRIGHDVDDNSMFWKPATVKALRDCDGYEDGLADVVFDERLDMVSIGHFVLAFRVLNDTSERSGGLSQKSLRRSSLKSRPF